MWRAEPGARIVAARLRSSGRVLVSEVNWAEATGKLREYRMTPRLRLLGLSLGDRACLAPVSDGQSLPWLVGSSPLAPTMTFGSFGSCGDVKQPNACPARGER